VGVWGKCVCARAAAPHRGAAWPPTARTPPRTRRAFVASRWNTYAARRREAPSRTALAPTSLAPTKLLPPCSPVAIDTDSVSLATASRC
jgi:hypothetical protein